MVDLMDTPVTEIARLIDIINKLERERTDERAEFEVCLEIYRWRSQDAEPAPAATPILISYLDYGGRTTEIGEIESFFDCDGCELYPSIYWRPLDAPYIPEEEEANDEQRF